MVERQSVCGICKWASFRGVCYNIINDIPKGINQSDCRLYADDTLLCFNDVNGDTQNLQEDVIKLEEWSNEWKMVFNAKKCTH